MPAPTFNLTVTPTTGSAIEFSDTVGVNGRVVSFTGDEHISRPFEYELVLQYHYTPVAGSPPPLDFSKLVNQDAVLTMEQRALDVKAADTPNDQARYIDTAVDVHGVLSHFRVTKKVMDGVLECKAVLVPKLWRLGMTRRSRVFQGLTTQQIVHDVLLAAGLVENTDFVFSLSAQGYPVREFCMQYQESDLDFIQRLLEYEGIFYYFDGGVLTFSDDKALPDIEDRKKVWFFDPQGAMGSDDQVRDFVYGEQIVPSTVTVQDYDFESFLSEKDNQPPVSTDVHASGEVHARVGEQREPGRFVVRKRDWVGEQGADPGGKLGSQAASTVTVRDGELLRLATIRAQEVEARRKTATATSTIARIQPGHVFELEEHFLFDDTYLVTTIHHHYVDGAYENSFTCLASDVQYRPPRSTPIPRVPGIMTAKVKGSDPNDDDAEPHIDDEGRYRVRFPFAPPEPAGGTGQVEEPSRPVRLAQPYAGKDYGMHFPNRGEVEMVLACLDGDPDRPLGLSVVPTPWKHTPVPNSKHGLGSQNPTTGSPQGSAAEVARQAAVDKAGADAEKAAEAAGKTRAEIRAAGKAAREAAEQRTKQEADAAAAAEKAAVDQAVQRAEDEARDAAVTAGKNQSEVDAAVEAAGNSARSAAKEADFAYYNTKNVIRTQRGHQLVMDDDGGGSNVGITLQVGKAKNSTGRDVYWGSKVELGGYRHLSVLERILGIASTATGFFRTAFTRDFPGMASEVLGIMASQVTTDDYVDDTYGTTTPVGVNIWTNKNVSVTGKDGVSITSPNLFGMFSTSLFNGDDDSKNQYQAEAISKFIINSIWQEVIDGTASEVLDVQKKMAKYKGRGYSNPKSIAALTWSEKFKKERISTLIFTLLQRTGINISSMGELKLTSLQSTSVAAGQGGLNLKSFGGIEQKADLDIEIAAHEGVKISSKGKPYKEGGIFKAIEKKSKVHPGLQTLLGRIKAAYRKKKGKPAKPDEIKIELENEEGDIFLHTGTGDDGGGDVMLHTEGKGHVKAFANEGGVQAWSGGEGVTLEVGSRDGLSENKANEPLEESRAKGRFFLNDRTMHGYSSKNIQFVVGGDYAKEDSGITIKEKSILIKCGQSSIEMKDNGDITLKGNNIVLKGGKKVTIDGTDVLSKAKKTMAMSGMKVSMDAKTQATLKGKVAAAVDGAITEVKGKMVKVG